MKNNYNLILLVLVILISCNHKSDQQILPKEQDTDLIGTGKLIEINNLLAVDSLVGYSIQATTDDIEIFREKQFSINGVIFPIDDYYLKWAKELDSIDIGRGFVMARALTGAGVGEPDGCGTNYSIDSIFEYRNKYNTRCFQIRIKGIMFCEDDLPDTSFYVGYFIDLSKGEDYKVLQIPNQLDFMDDKIITAVSKYFVNNILIKK